MAQIKLTENLYVKIAKEHNIDNALAKQAVAADLASDREEVKWGLIIEQAKNNLPVSALLNKEERVIFTKLIDGDTVDIAGIN